MEAERRKCPGVLLNGLLIVADKGSYLYGFSTAGLLALSCWTISDSGGFFKGISYFCSNVLCSFIPSIYLLAR
jgi:hypothetical protein